MSKQSDLVSVSQGSGGDPLYIDTTNDRVGVGTTSPDVLLELAKGSGEASLKFTRTNAASTGNDFGRILFENSSGTVMASIRAYSGSGNTEAGFTFGAGLNDTECVRIDNNGNLLVGTTDSTPVGSASNGTAIGNGIIESLKYKGASLKLDRYGDSNNPNNGSIIEFYSGSSGQVGSIGVTSSTLLSVVSSGTELHIGSSGATDAYFDVPDGVAFSVFAGFDNTADLGRSNARFDDIYATNGTIQTSDANEKQDIEALSDAEQRVAVAAKGLLRKYRWKDAVAEKGDAARIHFGIIAQDLQAAFEAEGLDAARYGMFISSTWWEADVEKTREVEQEDGTTITETYTATETYDEATEGATERTRLGVRYPELLAFIIAAL